MRSLCVEALLAVDVAAGVGLLCCPRGRVCRVHFECVYEAI